MYREFNRMILTMTIVLFVGNNILIADETSKDKKINVYVWDFDAKPPEDLNAQEFAKSVTEEIEELLIKSNMFRVLNRREYWNFFTQREQESGIKGIDHFNEKMIDTLKSINAEYVVFGKVDYNEPSGQVKLQASLQNFNSEKVAQATEYGARKLSLDPEERVKLVAALVKPILSKVKKLQSNESDNKSSSFFSANSWNNDRFTIRFGSTAERRAFLTGVRLVVEPHIGIAPFQKDITKLRIEGFKDLLKVGLETNLYHGFLALQVGFVLPSELNFVEESDVAGGLYLVDRSTYIVDSKLSFTVGFSFFNGIVAANYTRIGFDNKAFDSIYDGPLNQKLILFSIQPLSLIRLAVKSL
ncbi:MAG: hypothetical protein ACRBF0_17425 [Calditrichia bacterium]